MHNGVRVVIPVQNAIRITGNKGAGINKVLSLPKTDTDNQLFFIFHDRIVAKTEFLKQLIIYPYFTKLSMILPKNKIFSFTFFTPIDFDT